MRKLHPTVSPMQSIERATHVYIGRYQPCGCIVAVVVDESPYYPKETAKSVADFMRCGYVIERMTFEQYREATKDGIGCKCRRREEQATLFAAGGAEGAAAS